MRPPDVERPRSAAAQPGRESDSPGGRITDKPSFPAEPTQHSPRPDRYQLHQPAVWDVPGSDAARDLERLWLWRRS